MPRTAVQCIRIGDSGKGKISEKLSRRAKINARGTGGDNAGHVVQVGTHKVVLTLLPSGCVHEGAESVLGRGMVINPDTLMNHDIAEVQKIFGTNPVDKLIIDGRAHIIFLAHTRADETQEKNADAFGSTKKGISQAYTDKHNKRGKRWEWLLKRPDQVKDEYRKLVPGWKQRFGVDIGPDDQERELAILLQAKSMLEGNIRTEEQVEQYWQEALDADTPIILEGAQGTHLNIDSAHYPNVTSSPSTMHGLMQGVGLPFGVPVTVVGTLKAYDTYVGKHDVATPMDPETEERVRQAGKEFGSRTGRPRTTAWLNLFQALRYAKMEGVKYFALNKADPLDGEDEVKICTGFTDGRPEYKVLKGWRTATRDIRNYADMPGLTQEFHNAIMEYTGIPIGLYGTGPESDEIIDRRAELGLPA